MEGTATPVNRMKVSRKGFELMQTLLEKLEYDTQPKTNNTKRLGVTTHYRKSTMEHIDFVRFTNETVHLRSQYLNTIPVVPIVAAKEASNKIHHRHNSWQQEQEAIRQKVSLHYQKKQSQLYKDFDCRASISSLSASSSLIFHELQINLSNEKLRKRRKLLKLGAQHRLPLLKQPKQVMNPIITKPRNSLILFHNR